MTIQGDQESIQQVAEYLGRHATQDPPEGADAHELVVTPIFPGARGSPDKLGEPLQVLKVHPDENHHQVACDVVDRCIEHLRQTGGTCRYNLRLEGQSTAQRQITLIDGPVDGEDRERYRHIDPTSEGLAQVAIGGLDMVLRDTEEERRDVVKMYKAELDRAHERIRVLERSHVQHVIQLEEFVQSNHKRELELRTQERAEIRKDHVAQGLMAIAPVAVNKLVGANVVPTAPGHTTTLEAMISGFLSSLSPEQMQMCQKILRPEQMISMIEMVKVQQAQREAFEQQQRLGAAPSQDAKSPNGGGKGGSS